MRLLRSGMLEVLDSEYVKLARVKGVVERRVVWLHALKNALIPVVTFAGIYFAILVTTAIVVETVFAWPGLGPARLRGHQLARLPGDPGGGADHGRHRGGGEPRAWTASTRSSTRASAMPAEPRARLAAAAEPPRRRGPPDRRRARGRRLPVVPLGDHRASSCWWRSSRPLLSPADPHEQSLRNRFKPPVWEERGSWAHPLGTDRLGRDMLSRIVWGSRVSLAAGVVTVLLASAFGAAVGLVAGYYGGRVDAALMRVTDATHVVPGDPARADPRGDGRARASPTWSSPSR